MAGSRLHFDPDDRQFLAAASALIMANPFEVTRQDVARLAPDSALDDIGGDHPMTALLPVLAARLERLTERDAGALNRYEGAERQWLADAWLFHGYHRFVPDLDRLIERELAQPGQPATVSFADEALALLRSWGFSAQEATRYFGLFYQLRRAYTFIDHALIGLSPCMSDLRRALWNNVFGRDMRVYERDLWNRMEDFSTLLLGETGSGKGFGGDGHRPFGLHPLRSRRQTVPPQLHRHLHRHQPGGIPGKPDRIRTVRPSQGRFYRGG